MLNMRGGDSDVVKVLDFGLVKAVDEQHQGEKSAYRGLTGTPLYMSPESIQSPLTVDSRSDFYGLGAVAYFLLTGMPVFQADSIVNLCNMHVDEVPIAPSTRLGHPVSQELENAILACLEKTRAKRPQTARDLAEMLKRCPEASEWSFEKAEAWWRRHGRGPSKAPLAKEKPSSNPSKYEQTIASATETNH